MRDPTRTTATGTIGAAPRAPRRTATVVGSVWALLLVVAFAVFLAWGLIGRRDPDTPLGVVLGISVVVLPGLCAFAVRRAERARLRPLPARADQR